MIDNSTKVGGFEVTDIALCTLHSKYGGGGVENESLTLTSQLPKVILVCRYRRRGWLLTTQGLEPP